MKRVIVAILLAIAFLPFYNNSQVNPATHERAFNETRPKLHEKGVPDVQEVDDDDFIALLTSIHLLGEKEYDEIDLGIRVFKVDGRTGSAGNDSCEISHRLYIVVYKQMNELESRVYRLPAMYAPKLHSIELVDGKAILKLSFLNKGHRSYFSIEATNHSVRACPVIKGRT